MLTGWVHRLSLLTLLALEELFLTLGLLGILDIFRSQAIQEVFVDLVCAQVFNFLVNLAL